MDAFRRTGTFGLIAALGIGCAATRENCEILEARVRDQQAELAEMRSKVNSAKAEVAAMQRESDALRRQLVDRGDQVMLPEQAGMLYRATGIRIHKMLSGSLDRDEQPGEELFCTLVVPHDAQGEAVKLAGDLQLEVFDLASGDGQRQIGSWSFTADEVRDHWYSGFIGSGLMFRIPWQQIPSGDQIVVHARLTTADGRTFDTSESVRVAPPATELTSAEKPIDERPVLRTSDRWAPDDIPVIR